MTVITQRELRNDNAHIVRRLENGERFVVTRRGVPVADLVPHEPFDGPTRFVPVDVAFHALTGMGVAFAGFRDDQQQLDDVVDDADRDPWATR